MSEDRKRRIHFHVESHDYFSTLASIIVFIEESLQAEAEAMGKSLKEMTHTVSALKRINKDLLYLQESFVIERKQNSDVRDTPEQD